MASDTIRWDRQDLRRWLEAQGVEGGLPDDALLFSTGRLDSLTLVELLAWLEDTVGVAVSWSEVNLENFDSIARIDAFVKRTPRGR